MNILVTNDDGLSSEGLQVLASALSRDHDVWIVAPSMNRSGVSHGITMDEPLRFKQSGPKEFSCTGLPVDCSITGSQGIMPCIPDAIVSGINRGANLGTDIVYSGTAAAARQASFAGIPGIAVSLVSKTDEYLWQPLAGFIRDNLSALLSLCARDVFVNVNAPSISEYAGVRMTGVSRRDYRDSILMHDGPDGCKYSFFRGGDIQTDGDEKSDFEAVESGCVSISRIASQPFALEPDAGQARLFRL
ncbi:5'/3'-nucleotidase SurE [Treponema zuelzerae]|uniref:5'-nucleotidase SurE n=1 Tax=Teretinema zuelzerae TaxID=156 RepID=A0AAE3EJC0_9SPIR|nr:5'/3'-nucleotidase SurE [Teretinema zuelzerae]MCD1654843.1 5'/3'-nucleotidase SurE [Teretinema zuelzerae]